MSTHIQEIFPDLKLETCLNEVKRHLTYVIENSTDEQDRFFKARSYIELADLYHTTKTTYLGKTKYIKEIINLVHQGVQCLPNNTVILMKAGRILRHCFQFKEAEKLLQKAYDICPNSTNCHQLGLVHKKKIIHFHEKRKDPKKQNKISGSSRSLSTDGPTQAEKELPETLSKVSLSDSKTYEDVSTTKTAQCKDPIVKMKRLINSPGKETFDPELSRKLEESCIDLFRQSAELGQGCNLAVYYDWGITLLKMTPTKFDEVMEKFNYILENESFLIRRYRCYEQYGICKLRMSESQEFDDTSREDYHQSAVEMFRRAISCWAYCQKLNLSNHFDDAEGNCSSLKSIREIILGEDSKQGIKPKKDMASLYYLVKQYGSSLSLYQEVHDELQRTSNTDTDSEVIKGIINSHIQLKQFTGILDMLALLLCSTEGLQCLEFKTDVLTQLMYHSIDTNDYLLSESVFNFEKNPNEECDCDVAIIFNEDDKDMKKTGATLQNWLCAFSKSVLKVTKSSETAANLPRLEEQIKLICNSKMVIFILTNDNPTKLTYLMNSALEARCNDDYVLKKIFPISINDGMVPDIFKDFKSIKVTQDPNTVDEHEKTVFLKTFSDIFLQ